MLRNQTVLIATLIFFLLLGGSGLILFFVFDSDLFLKYWGLGKDQWLDFHMISASIVLVLTIYHIGSRWFWFERFIFSKERNSVSTAIRQRQLINSLALLLFIVSVLSGFLSWIMAGECLICLEIHKINGLFLFFYFGVSYYNSSKRFFLNNK
jgi:hypothetical protein